MFIFIISIQYSYGQLLSPTDFLPNKYEKEFTAHNDLVDYFKHVAENNDQVILHEYGRTNEHRPLICAFISSPNNISNLEKIRDNNLIRTGLEKGEINPKFDKAIVWLSYSVHGNEAAGSEASMRVLYELINRENSAPIDWLENTIIIIDPSLNPDGYHRYSHWNNRVSTNPINVHPDAIEHNEPWPGGRTNHYWYDLNRDWAWQTQIESQARGKLYLNWMPHVHADLHEMGMNSPYYFAPAAQPYHTFITDWQSKFQVDIGRNHARYFDKEGWRYFTKEIYDLLYPSYGDTYPTFNGAIGMTYEQGGSGAAGRAIKLISGDTLTLKDRIDHHTTASLSTIEIASQNKDQLIREFGSYFDMAKNNPPGKYKTYVISKSNSKGKVNRLLSLLDKNGIAYGLANKEQSIRGFDYYQGTDGSYNIRKDDIIISAFQPKGVLTQVLFDPEPEVVDSLTYDITSWALPFAYGLKAMATSEKIIDYIPIQMNSELQNESFYKSTSFKESPYAYIVEWANMVDANTISQMVSKGLIGRVATEEFTIGLKKYKSGSVVFTKADNRKRTDFHQIFQDALKTNQESISTTSTGFVDKGKDLGSSSYKLIRNPKIVSIVGEGVYSLSVGQIWHFCEKEINLPITLVEVDQLNSIDWDNYTTLVLPEGNYQIEDKSMESIKEWIKEGGQLIAIGSGLNKLVDKDGFSLTRYTDEVEKSEMAQKIENNNKESKLNAYTDGEREAISFNAPGAVFKAKVDNTHPLAFGLDEVYYSLKTGSVHFDYLLKGENVIYLTDSIEYFGFVGAKAIPKLKTSLIFGTENMGSGSVVYMVDNPLFRSFWEQGKFIFSNALFFAGK